ncbi:hypothetical protein [Streptomyces sp. NBC_01429]|uniref:hypothetical protein n=1 Tax=Streptomyces sp. NBC_01429 TaxID=2903862 RepID=UPI002E2DE022|nr:hypothetical protein [Streptomyces sp. NBC_01429]
MSRETDSSSSGPQGRGGAAYPSGTPPYGTRQYPSLHPQQDAPEETETAPAPQPDEPRTETTLTTRIRINIPGSRPIPPVVMRTPVADGDSTNGRGVPVAERTASIPRPEVPAETAEPRQAEPAREEPAEEKAPTSDWFAPRKPSSGTGPGAGTAAGMGAGAAAVSGGGRSESPYPSEPYSSEPYPSQGSAQDGLSGTGGPLGGLASEAGASGAASNGFAPGPVTPPLGGRPSGADGAPSGPTTGPVTGGLSLGTAPASLGTPPTGGAPRMSDDTAVLTPQQPAPVPGSGPGVPGTAAGPGGPGGHVSGDTLTSGIPVVPPEHHGGFPGSGPGTGGPGGGPRTGARPGSEGSGSPGQEQGFSAPDFPGPVGSAQGAPPSGTAPRAAAPAPAAPAKKKGRSKLTLLGVAVVVLGGGVYGAGLLMNHSEVAKGTTVLGVDIGGGTREEAVAKLDATLGGRAAKPLRLDIGGKTEELSPDKAGLSFDSQATVRGAAGSDYNPVSVIGSLFGAARVAEPVIPVDEEKLSAALNDLAGTSGSATEGTIKFEPDKAVAVPGKSGKALDVNHSIISTRDAYRTQVQTGRTNPVELPVTTREPTIGQAELDRAMNEFAKPAMSGLITIQAGGKQIQFGPSRSLPQILSMKPIDGKLVEVYDRNAIDQLLEGVFDGITITKGDGKQYPVSSTDVAQAMQKALRGKTPTERTQTIDLDPS